MEQHAPADSGSEQPKARPRWSHTVARHLAMLINDWTRPSLPLQPKPCGFGLARFCGRVRLPDLKNNSRNTVFAARLRRTWVFESVQAERFNFPTADERENFIRSTSILLDAKQAHVQWIIGTCTNGLDVYVIRPSIELCSIPAHLRSVPTTDRRQLVVDAARALCFLHDNNIVHGDVQLRNLLITPSGFTVLSAYALLQPPSTPDRSHSMDLLATSLQTLHVPDPSPSDSDLSIADDPEWDMDGPPFSVKRDGSMDDQTALSARLHLRSSEPAGDLFAFGFLIVELFTEVGVHESPSALTLLCMALAHEEPPHPGRFAEVLGLDIILWDLCKQLWRSHPAGGITAREALQLIASPPQNIIRSPYQWRDEDLAAWAKGAVSSLDGKIHDMQTVKTERDIEHALYELRGTWCKSDKSTQTVKLVHPSHCRRGMLRKERVFLAELFVWNQLHHENVLPILGTVYCEQEDATCFVVPWMEGGTCIDYLCAHPHADRLKIQLDVAAALQYLHSRSPSIIHGDLRAHSVWISETGQPFIANFDFTPIHQPGAPFDISDPTWPLTFGRWAPPEGISRGKKSDVFSFGLFSYELYSGQPPFHQSSFDTARYMINSNQRPDRPECSTLTDDVWDVIQRCWRHSIPARPSMRKVLSRLQELSINHASHSA